MQAFWQYWTGNGAPERSIMDAHFDAHYVKVFNNPQLGRNISPAILTSYQAGTQHLYLNDTYHSATSEQGYPGIYCYYYEEYIH